MIENVDTNVAEIGIRLLDDAYLAWLSAATECEGALRAWYQTVWAARERAYLSYRGALEREEAAARDLERLWRVSAPCRTALVHGSESVC